MRIHDKYIIRQYLYWFAIILTSICILFIIIDVIDRLPRILRDSTDVMLITQYFLWHIPYLFVLVSPVIVLMSGLFLMSSLSKYNESIAIRAAGVSILRLVTPLLVIGLIMSVIIGLFGEVVLPYAENRKAEILNVQIRGREREDIRMRSNIFYSDVNHIFYLGFFDGFQNIIRVIDITEVDDNNDIVREIQANDATWDGENWVFSNTHDRRFDGSEMISYSFYRQKIIPEITVTPTDFIKSAKNPMQMNFMELSEYKNRLKRIGDKYHRELTDLYSKISFPLANFIILLFCVPLATASVRSKGRGIIFILGFIICFFYLMTLRVCQSLGYNEIISPFAAAWFPHILFFVVGLFFVVKSEV